MENTLNISLVRIESRALPQTFDEKSNTMEILCSKRGARIKTWNWDIGYYLQELSLDPAHVNLERFNSGRANFLYGHDWENFDSILGRIVSARVTDEGLVATIELTKRESAQEMVGELKSGILSNISIGFYPEKMRLLESAEGALPVYLVEQWEPVEASAVSVPADAGAYVRSKDQKQNAHTRECLIINDITKENIMSEKNPANPSAVDPAQTRAADPVNPGAPAQQPPQPSAADGEAREHDRVSSILRSAKVAGLPANFSQDLILRKVPKDQALNLINDEWEKNNSPTPRTQTVTVGLEDKDHLRAGAEEALYARANPNHKMDDKGRQFRSMPLLRLAEKFIGEDKAAGLNRSQIAKRALGTSDFTTLFGSVLNRTLRRNFEEAQRTFRPFVTIGSLSDYREATRAASGAVGNLKLKREGDEYEEGSFGEGGEKIKLLKYGRIIQLTEELIVNDDLGVLVSLPKKLGAAAARKESEIVYGILTGSHLMSDGEELFSAAHNNLVTPGTEISEDNMDILNQKLRKQTDGDSNLDIFAKFIISGSTREAKIRKFLATQILPGKAADVNPFAGAYSQIVDNRITSNAWYLSADPNQFDTIEVAYLDGQEGPEISEAENFRSDSVDYKIKHVFGAKALDHRGMAKNVGV